MKNQIATTREQSARLLACGVKPETADMFIGKLSDETEFLVVNETESDVDNPDQLEGTPAWSLSALMALLPIELMWQGLYFRLVMGPNKDKWEIEYNDLSVLNNAHRVIADNPIEATVQLIEWLTANKYSLNNIEQ